MIWLVLVPMALLVAAGLVLPLLRSDGSRRVAPPPTLDRRLDQIERQHEKGEISGAETEALRNETERRLAAEARAGEAEARPMSPRALRVAGGAIAALTLLGAGGLYLLLGRPDLAGREAVVAAETQQGVEGMIAALEAQLRETPEDAQLLALLGQGYSETGRYAEAAAAFGQASRFAPDNPGLMSARGEALVQAAGGRVTEDAAVAFRAASVLDPADARARYFLALAKDQAGDRDGAMDDWIALLNAAPEGAPWVPQVRAFVEQVAAERGIDVSARLGPASGSDGAGSPGS